MNQHCKSPFPEGPALAIAYVKWQESVVVCEAEEGYLRGTIFPDLDKPFYGRRARYGMQKCR